MHGSESFRSQVFGGERVSAKALAIIDNYFGKKSQVAPPTIKIDGDPEVDVELRDYEYVPFNEDINKYFDREVRPYLPHAFINTSVKDEKDGAIGLVGVEISVSREFYKHQPHQPLEEIKAQIDEMEKKFMSMLKGVLN